VSKESEKLNDRKIFNNYELTLQGDKVWCEFSPSPGGRMGIGHVSGWRVHAIGKKLSTAWYDYGSKNFYGNKNDEDALCAALMLCKKLTGQNEFVLSPFGGYVSLATAKKVGFKITKRIKISL
jgi:hypothetical protein